MSVLFNLFQPNATSHIETSHLFCLEKQMTGFFMKGNIGLKWVMNFRGMSMDFKLFLGNGFCFVKAITTKTDMHNPSRHLPAQSLQKKH